MNPAFSALCGVITAVFSGLFVYGFILRPKAEEARRDRLEAEAAERRTHEEARIAAEKTLLAAKEEAIRIRDAADAAAKEKLLALQKTEDRVCAREDALDARRSAIDAREGELVRESRVLAEKEDLLERRLRAAEEELMRIGNLDKAKARDLYLKRVESEFREAGAQRAREVEGQIAGEAERKAKKAVLDVIQRHVVDYVTEATLAVVELPSEDMKGRIIGREGRNIRAFEQTTGVDLIVDETPEAVVISCFDPVRRETARLTLMNLMLDGRIHPSRIEELHEKAQEEVARMVKEAGERAAERADVGILPPRVIETMGRLRFRTSYAQNVLDHSVEVARLAASLAHELGLNAEVAKRAGFLHDIGKALGPEWEGPHAVTGMEYLRTMGEKDPVLHAVGAHHHDIEPSSPEAVLVILADTISASRPGARRESLENHIKRLTALETLANSFPGVDRSYAIQAGREVRLIVKPDAVDDLGARRLALQVAKRIEGELEYPGQIKVTVIRETRASEVAK
jgi:ribonuclease Y